MIFSYVESNNFHHLCVFGLITDLKQGKNVLGNLMVFRLNPERGGGASINYDEIFGTVEERVQEKNRSGHD